LIRSKIDIIADKYGISRDTIKNDYTKLVEQIDNIIQDKKPGPKVKGNKLIKMSDKKPKKIKPPKEDLTCPKCGSKDISRNIYVNDCMASVAGKQRIENNYLRQAIKLQIAKLICILRFKEGLSVRPISYIVKMIYGVNGSIGHIVELCDKVSKNGKEKLVKINKCSQSGAKTMIFDETFPKTKTSGTTNLGTVMDENGLIRGVQTIVKKYR